MGEAMPTNIAVYQSRDVMAQPQTVESNQRAAAEVKALEQTIASLQLRLEALRKPIIEGVLEPYNSKSMQDSLDDAADKGLEQEQPHV